MLNKHLIVIAGPTAVGKTSLSIRLAKTLGSVIISCDSRQFFREMTIGTAKPSSEELLAVPHYFINTLSVFDEYNIGDFEADVLTKLEELFKQYDVVFMVGGSGLYIKAVCDGLDTFPPIQEGVRNQIQTQYAEKGLAYLQEQLQHLDPIYYAKVDVHNPQRMMRALEVCLSTDQPYSSFLQKNTVQRSFNIIKIGLTLERSLLYDRINKRVEMMMDEGLLKEAKNLYPHKHLNALQTVGYKELFDYFDEQISLDEAIELIKRNSRRYAKRQLTWFKKTKQIHWFEPHQYEQLLAFIQEEMNNNSV